MQSCGYAITRSQKEQHKDRRTYLDSVLDLLLELVRDVAAVRDVADARQRRGRRELLRKGWQPGGAAAHFRSFLLRWHDGEGSHHKQLPASAMHKMHRQRSTACSAVSRTGQQGQLQDTRRALAMQAHGGALGVDAAGQQALRAAGGRVGEHALQAAEHVAAQLRVAVGALVRARLRALDRPRAHQLRAGPRRSGAWLRRPPGRELRTCGACAHMHPADDHHHGIPILQDPSAKA